MEAGSGRVSVGVVGGWMLLEPLLLDVPTPLAGAGAELSAAWAPTRRVAVTVVGGAGALTTGAVGLAGMGTVRVLVHDGAALRVAPWLAGGLASDLESRAPFVTGGVALEVPFYAVLVDASVPLGGASFGAAPAFLPTMLLAELGFTWTLGERTSVRLGYLAAAATISWRWRSGPWTVEVGGDTNVVSGNLAGRVGVAF